MSNLKKSPSGVRPRVEPEQIAAELARVIAQLLNAGAAPTPAQTQKAPPAPVLVPKGPPNPSKIVGEIFYVRVSNKRVLVEVIEDTQDPRRPYRLRRVDNGRVLGRLRSAAALHVTDTALPFPPKASE